MKTKLLGAVCVVFAIAVSSLAFSDIARSDVLFSDDFNSGASAAWGNESGNWTANAGVYRAQDANNFPNSQSFVSPFPSLTDFSVSVDVTSARDGGICGYFLRAGACR